MAVTEQQFDNPRSCWVTTECNAAELLAWVAALDVTAGDEGVFRIAATDRVISTVDVEARHSVSIRTPN